jgi:hypothetical protein
MRFEKRLARLEAEADRQEAGIIAAYVQPDGSVIDAFKRAIIDPEAIRSRGGIVFFVDEEELGL